MIKDLECERNLIHCHKNPIKVCALLIEVISRIVKYPMLQVKVLNLTKELEDLALEIQSKIEDEEVMKLVFFERDIENRELITIVANVGLIQMFSNSLMSKIVIDIWEGPYAVKYDYLRFLTPYNVLTQSSLRSKVDFEKQIRNKFEPPVTHDFSFLVWRDGIAFRYIINAIVIVLLAFIMSSDVAY